MSEQDTFGAGRLRRRPDGSLPHVGLGGARRSMYAEGANTLDEAERMRQALDRLIDAAREAGARISDAVTDMARGMQEAVDAERDVIRVQATVGEPIREIEQ